MQCNFLDWIWLPPFPSLFGHFFQKGPKQYRFEYTKSAMEFLGPRGPFGTPSFARGPRMAAGCNTMQHPPCCHSRSLFKTQGIKFLTNIFKFKGFIDPSDQNELYHTPLLSKIWGLSFRRKKLLYRPFKSLFWFLVASFSFWFLQIHLKLQINSVAVCLLTIFDILTLFAEMERPADTANISVLFFSFECAIRVISRHMSRMGGVVKLMSFVVFFMYFMYNTHEYNCILYNTHEDKCVIQNIWKRRGLKHKTVLWGKAPHCQSFLSVLWYLAETRALVLLFRPGEKKAKA